MTDVTELSHEFRYPHKAEPLLDQVTALKEVKDFKYLGVWVNSTEQDLKVRNIAWKALNGMASVWNANLPCQIKLSFFHPSVASVILYGRQVNAGPLSQLCKSL